MRQKKQEPRNPRPKIDYPAFETRPWVPPDERPKKKRKPKYEKPPGISQKLAISSLGRIWHQFKILDGRTILTGHFSESHKRFRPRSVGYQTPCNCIMGICFSKFYDMAKWDSYTIDRILDMGDQYYYISLYQQDNRLKTCFALHEVYPTFIFEDNKITISMKGERYTGKLFEDTDDSPFLSNVIDRFFGDGHEAGVIATQGKFMAFWLAGEVYYLFDPTEHTRKGYPWPGVPGLGFAMVMRFHDTEPLVGVIHENVNTKQNSSFVITPVFIIRKVKIDATPPENSTVIKPHCVDFKLSEFKIVPSRPPPKEPTTEEEEGEGEEEIEVHELMEEEEFGEQDEIEEFSPEIVAAGLQMPEVLPRRSISKSMIPLEKAKAESVTYFNTLASDKMGILRASTHQSDTRVTNLKGKQALGNAFAALAMLRILKSRNWFKRIVDDVLKLGIVYHNESVKQLPAGQKIKVTTMASQIKVEDRVLAPDVDEFSVVGALQSAKDEVFDLLPALQEFFRDNQTCVITGPLTLAVWFEDGFFYMFDPNERDKSGHAIVKSIQIGSELMVLDYVPGVACVTWYKDLKDLVGVYFGNVEKAKRRDPFVISRVHINDFVAIPESWHNFQGVSHGKWILRGTMNEKDHKFDKDDRGRQGTAASVMALVYAKLKHVKTWTTEIIDQILYSGTELHQNSVSELKSSGRYFSPMLLVAEVQRKFPIFGIEINLDISDCLVNGLIDAKDDNDALNLKKGLQEFFKNNDAALVTSHDISVAVWKTDEVFYYFDPHIRDENGVIAYVGTACALRTPCLNELTRSIESNLTPSTNNMFNINRVDVIVWEAAEGGIVRPPLNNYTEVNETTSILRSLYSQRSSVFKLNVDKQTVPMILASLGMMQLYPGVLWTRDVLDQVLIVGDKLYTDTMIEREKNSQMGVSEDTDEVVPDNCLLNFEIGLNKLIMSYGSPVDGTFDYEFEPMMQTFLEQANEEKKQEALVYSELYKVAIWVDDGLYYLFDPNPRDDTGGVYGKEEWSAKYVPPEGEDDYDTFMEMMGAGDGGPNRKSIGSQAPEGGEDGGAEEGEKHDATYWKTQEENGRACVMWFTTQNKLIQFILENIPPNKREYVTFQILPVNVEAKTEVKQVYDPVNPATRLDNYSGDWYHFKEIDHGWWILRGTMDCTHVMFPEHNRGKQSLSMCYAALSYVKRFALSQFKNVTVDDILKYGDRIHTATRKVRFKEMRQNKDYPLSSAEIEAYLNRQVFGPEDVVRAFCIGTDQMVVDIHPEVMTGDIRAQNVPEIFDIRRGLETYFAENKFGVLCCKNLTVAIWRGAKVFFMFDPNSRGPNGTQCVNGEACITRYLELGVLTDVFLNNLTKEGMNSFTIHQVKVRIQHCPREPKPEEKERPEVPLYHGYNMVMPGKCVLRGTINQDDPRFGHGKNAACATIAVIALTMTLIHKASSWTKPIVDDILVLGDELYTATLDSLGYEYNPWEQGMTLHLVNKDYKMGTLKANCELRTMDQRGIIDIKHPTIQNLRQGIENFFEENTHGVIETESLTVAIWEEEEQPGLFYMFDPNPRGPAGLFIPGGTACVINFETPKMAADHFIANIIDKSKRTGEFVITPVEIVVGSMRTMPKKDKYPCPKKPGELKQPSPTPCEKKRLRKMAELERQKKEAHRLAKLGKFEFHPLSNGDAMLRGNKSQYWSGYSENSRGNQDLPNCFSAFVVNHLVPILNWHHKHIDMVLDVGDQLYKDSYITYGPKDPKLGLPNVLRRIFIKEVRLSLKVYKPVMSNTLTQFNLEMALLNYFQQENFCILSAHNEHNAVFFKEGLYYMFDPHDRDVEGNKCPMGTGNACLMRFQTLPNLVSRFIANIASVFDTMGFFTVTLVTIGNIVQADQIPTTSGGSRGGSKSGGSRK